MNNQTIPLEDIPIACQLLPTDFQKRRETLMQSTIVQFSQVTELENGYQFHYLGSDDVAMELVEFINFERQCCPFLTFELGFAPQGAGITLSILGNNEIKTFIQENFVITT